MLFEKIDDFIFSYMEWIAHKFQKITGKDCFWLAELCVWTFLVIWMLYAIFEIESKAKLSSNTISQLFLKGFIAISSYILIHICKRKYMQNPELKNPERCRDLARVIRCGWSFISFFDLTVFLSSTSISPYSLISLMSDVNIVAALYFMACTPLPPGISSIRKMLNKIREVFTPIHETIPDPVPS